MESQSSFRCVLGAGGWKWIWRFRRPSRVQGHTSIRVANCIQLQPGEMKEKKNPCSNQLLLLHSAARCSMRSDEVGISGRMIFMSYLIYYLKSYLKTFKSVIKSVWNHFNRVAAYPARLGHSILLGLLHQREPGSHGGANANVSVRINRLVDPVFAALCVCVSHHSDILLRNDLYILHICHSTRLSYNNPASCQTADFSPERGGNLLILFILAACRGSLAASAGMRRHIGPAGIQRRERATDRRTELE